MQINNTGRNMTVTGMNLGQTEKKMWASSCLSLRKSGKKRSGKHHFTLKNNNVYYVLWFISMRERAWFSCNASLINTRPVQEMREWKSHMKRNLVCVMFHNWWRWMTGSTSCSDLSHSRPGWCDTAEAPCGVAPPKTGSVLFLAHTPLLR